MKKSTNALDDFLQSKVEEAGFSFQEEYWQKMSTLLDEEEQKKKRPFFWLWRGLSMLAILLTIGAGGYLMNKSNNSKVEREKSKEVAVKEEDMAKDLVKDQIPKDQIPNSKETQAVTKPEPSESVTSKPLSSNTLNSKPSTSKPSTSKPETSEPSTFKPVSFKSSTSKPETSEPVTFKPLSSKPLTSKPATSKPSTPKHLNSQLSTLNSQLLTSKPATTKPETSESATSNPLNSQLSTLNSEPQTSQPSTSNPITGIINGQTVKAIDTNRYTIKHRDESVYNPRYLSSLNGYIPERLDSVTAIRYEPVQADKLDSSNAPPSLFTAESKNPFVKHPFGLILLAGANFNKGLSGNISAPVSWGISPYAGAGIEKRVSNKLTIASHVGFTYFNGLNLQMTVPSYQYGFGLDSSSFTVEYKKLLQLYLPVSFYYDVFKKHSLMASLGMSYSMDVSSKVTETSMSNNTGHPGTASKPATSTSSMQYGYRTGFNKVDVYAQVGYAYRMFDHITLQAAIQQGFFDMTKNSYFKNTTNNTQTRISIGLKYNFKRN